MSRFQPYSENPTQSGRLQVPATAKPEKLSKYPDNEMVQRDCNSKTYTQIFARISAIPKIYAKRTATSPRNGKNMRNYPNIRPKWPLQTLNRHFQVLFSFFEPYRTPKSEKSKKKILNNRLQRTSHKVRRPLNRDVMHQ